MLLIMSDDKLLVLLDSILSKPEIASLMDDSVNRLAIKLAETPDELFVWETIPLSHFSGMLPPAIGSCWVFYIRSGMPPEKHRHPNSRQITMSWRGSGDLQTATGEAWSSNVLVEGLSPRWLLIPPNVWHRPVVDSNWAVVSFHTVSAEDLIEEAGEEQKTRKYVNAPQ
jgi:hypothetical protein